MKLTGKLTKILANFYYVRDDHDKVWECFARGRLIKEGKYLFVGDLVEIETSSDTQGVIVNVLERKNKLLKPPVSNVDQVLVVFSSIEPDLDFYNLDRYLSCVKYGLPDEDVVICINKIDLKNINIDKIYANSGFDIVYVSALTGENLDKLSLYLGEKTTVLTGPSGVGKSSLIKALSLSNDESIKIGDLSAIKKGKQITRFCQLIYLNNYNVQGYLVDTPGFTQINFHALDPNKVLATFRELCDLDCSFSNCLHSSESGCKIQQELAVNNVPESRYKNYLKILEETKSEITYKGKEESQVKVTGGKGAVKGRKIPKISQELRAKSRKTQKQELLNEE